MGHVQDLHGAASNARAAVDTATAAAWMAQRGAQEADAEAARTWITVALDAVQLAISHLQTSEQHLDLALTWAGAKVRDPVKLGGRR